MQTDSPSPFGPLLLWLILQLAALGISAARVPFYAPNHFPRPAETLALVVMLAVQIGSLAMLFPYLLRDARAAGFVIVAGWPFTLLAQYLTGQPGFYSALVTAPLVSVWILGLALWRPVLRSPRATGVGVTLATLAAFLGPLAIYLRAEYGSSSGGITTHGWGPILAGLAVAERGVRVTGAWIFFAAHLGVATVAWIASRLMSRAASKSVR